MLVNSPQRPSSLQHLQLVWAVRPRSNLELFALALELGNLHVSVEIAADEVLVAPDGPVEEVLERMNLTWETRQAT